MNSFFIYLLSDEVKEAFEKTPLFVRVGIFYKKRLNRILCVLRGLKTKLTSR